MGHMNNAVYSTFLEEARIDVVGDLADFILARVEIDFRAQLRRGTRSRSTPAATERTGGSYRDGICCPDPYRGHRAARRGPGRGHRGRAQRARVPAPRRSARRAIGRHLLLVLDNCEHVVQAAAVLAERLLETDPRRRASGDQREQLEVDGEHVWQVRPLRSAARKLPAVRLFLDRARAADPASARQDPEVHAVAGLCASLDGLPLAIELAAARLPGTTVSELAGNLRDRFGLLTVGRRAGGRHRSTARWWTGPTSSSPPGSRTCSGSWRCSTAASTPLPPARSDRRARRPGRGDPPRAAPRRPLPGHRRAGRGHDRVDLICSQFRFQLHLLLPRRLLFLVNIILQTL